MLGLMLLKIIGFSIWYFDMVPGSAVYMPPGFVFWEKFGDSVDFAGAKTNLFLTHKRNSENEPEGKDSEQLTSELVRKLNDIKAPCPVMQDMATMLGAMSTAGDS